MCDMCYRIESDCIKPRKIHCCPCYFNGLFIMKYEVERCRDKTIDRLKNSESFCSV